MKNVSLLDSLLSLNKLGGTVWFSLNGELLK
jgi:hypothetical protein